MPGFGFGAFVGHFQAFEKQVAYLFGGTDVEFDPGLFVNGLLQGLNLYVQFFGIKIQIIAVDANAFVFQIGQHFDQRALDGIKKFLHAALFQFWRKKFFQLQGNVGIFSGVIRYFFQIYLAHVELILTFFANQHFDRNG